MSDSNRRDFLKTSAAALATPALAASRLSPNDRLRVAVVGLRGRGRSHIQAFHELAGQNVEIAAFCDVDRPILEERAAGYERTSGKRIKLCSDMREVLDDKSIHAVSFATPNHWHALGTIWACQAGKDVYVEKPGTHNFAEGPKIIEAARRYNRVVQHGTQNRSSPNVVEAIAKLKEGVIGRVYLARGVAFKTHPSFGRITPDPVPAGLNWDAWLGPAPMVPYSKKRQSAPAGASWHLLWDYGAGDIGNQGVHELDIIRWGLGLDSHPSKIVSMGGNYVYPGDEQQGPQIQSIMYEWPGRDVFVSFETRSGLTNTPFSAASARKAQARSERATSRICRTSRISSRRCAAESPRT